VLDVQRIGVRFSAGATNLSLFVGILFSPKTHQLPSGTSFPEIKQPGSDAERSFSSGADDKKEWSYSLHSIMPSW
jgi:hypothetical protein